jgi:tartrate dehydratase beta subunit/fumarate hydratase class I family protein
MATAKRELHAQIKKLQAEIAQLKARVAALEATPAISYYAPPTVTFSKDFVIPTGPTADAKAMRSFVNRAIKSAGLR